MSGLKPTSRALVEHAFAVLRLKEANYQDGEEWLPEWVPRGGSFLLGPRRLRRFESCLQSEMHRLPETPQARRFHAALGRDRRTSPLLGRLVGTPSSGVLVEPDGLQRSLLWSVAAEGGGFHFQPDAFEVAYGKWLGNLTAKTQRVKSVATLHPLSFTGRLELTRGLEIGQLTDDEVSDCLRMGAIEASFAGTGMAIVSNRAAIRIEWDEPRGLHDEFTEEERQRAWQRETGARQVADQVVEALRVFSPGRVAVRGTLTIRGDGSLQGGPVAGTPMRGEAMQLDGRSARTFARFWPLYLKARQQRAVSAAIRRFSYAGERSRSDDAIVDLVAALEGLILSDITEMGEFKFRTSLRGALLVKHTGYTRHQVQRQLKHAYDVRSAVAHGKTPRPTDLRGPTDEKLDLDSFVASIELLARSTIKTAVQRVASGRGWPPDWDTLMLGRVTSV